MPPAGSQGPKARNPDASQIPQSQFESSLPYRPLYSYKCYHSPEARATCARSTRHAPIRPRLGPVCGRCACFPGCAVRCCLVFQVLYMEAGQMTESDFSLFSRELYHVKAAHAWHSVSHRPPGLCSKAVRVMCRVWSFSRESGITLSRAISARSPSVPAVWFIPQKRACLQSGGVLSSTNPHPHPHSFHHHTLIGMQLYTL